MVFNCSISHTHSKLGRAQRPPCGTKTPPHSDFSTLAFNFRMFQDCIAFLLLSGARMSQVSTSFNSPVSMSKTYPITLVSLRTNGCFLKNSISSWTLFGILYSQLVETLSFSVSAITYSVKVNPSNSILAASSFERAVRDSRRMSSVACVRPQSTI